MQRSQTTLKELGAFTSAPPFLNVDPFRRIMGLNTRAALNIISAASLGGWLRLMPHEGSATNVIFLAFYG